jgi:hypothetical protein
MNLLFWGLTISMLGKVLLAIGVLKAHSQIAHEHRIDAKVLRTFRTEMWITIAGLIFILAGYGMEVVFYGFETPFFTCSLHNNCEEEAAALILSR